MVSTTKPALVAGWQHDEQALGMAVLRMILGRTLRLHVSGEQYFNRQ